VLLAVLVSAKEHQVFSVKALPIIRRRGLGWLEMLQDSRIFCGLQVILVGRTTESPDWLKNQSKRSRFAESRLKGKARRELGIDVSIDGSSPAS
jgi:hypothetical protein